MAKSGIRPKNKNIKPPYCGGSVRVHGKSPERLWNTWINMRARCNKENDPAFRHYGGRGISICEEWNDSFVSFRDWAFSSGWEPHLELDRTNNDGNYEPSNCRWATREEQVNNRRCTTQLEFNGEIRTHSQWEKLLGLADGFIRRRLNRGFKPDEVLLIPVGMKRREFYAS